MRLIAFSLVTSAITSACLLALFVYALHVPTRTAQYVEGPSAIASPANPSTQRADWPERWAAISFRTLK